MAIVRLSQPSVVLPPVPPTAPPAGAPGIVEAGSEPPTEPPTGPDSRLVVGMSLLVAVAWWVCVWLSREFWDPGGLASRQLVEGVSIFALLYVAAQAVERLLEPASQLLLPIAKAEKERDSALAAFQKEKTTTSATEAAKKQASLERRRSNRSVLFWGLATVIGLFTAGTLRLYFLRTLGISDSERWAEILVTGLVIGAGTKPLHDLISRIEKAKEKATDPAEVS
jgi:hypothetical protein